MNNKKQLSILEFSRLTGIKRENLRFYDRIGLLSPEERGENNYRYYSRHQLNTAYLIVSLRSFGVGIEDIRKYVADQTPEKTMKLFEQQMARIQSEIKRLNEKKLIMQMYSQTTKDAVAHNWNDIFLQEKEREPIFLCHQIPDEMDEEQGEIMSYDFAEENGIDLASPQGVLVNKERLLSNDFQKFDKCYFRVGQGGNAFKEAGLYAVEYQMCDSWNVESAYKRLLNFIEEQGLEICGDAFEEYPIGELDTKKGLGCIRLEIPVKNQFNN